ncbi:MAG: hypothetical protein LBL62_11495 [Planctomycetaceae bacterium]|nr:hypothetical protein [Planctomycetaceae bacterium]
MAKDIAFRFGVDKESTGATVPRTDRPPYGCLLISTKIPLNYYEVHL